MVATQSRIKSRKYSDLGEPYTPICSNYRNIQELVKFDTQAMENPEISGIEYQQGELAGYEIREYLLEKWGRKCAYCNAQNVPLEIEHIHPSSKGGSSRVSNLTIACRHCNEAKGNQELKDFLAQKPELLNRITKQAKKTLKDAAAVNSTRWQLFNRLKETSLPVETEQVVEPNTIVLDWNYQKLIG
jgi:hypothetical protein